MGKLLKRVSHVRSMMVQNHVVFLNFYIFFPFFHSCLLASILHPRGMAAMTPHLFIELPVGTLFLQYIQSRLVSPPLLLFFPLFFYDSICCQHALYNIYVRMGISLIFKYQLKIFSYHILSYIIFMSIQHLIYVTIYLDQKEKKKKKTNTLVSHR